MAAKVYLEAIEIIMSEAERLEAGPQIWAEMEELDTMVESFKLLKKEKTAEIDVKKECVKLKASQYNKGVKQEQVLVTEDIVEKKPNVYVVQVVRQDTGEVLRERDCTVDEIQQTVNMFDTKSEAKMAN